MGDPLRSLPLLLRLSRETVRIIRQNILIFAFGVNGLGILLTAWLWPLFLPKEWHEQAPLAAVVYHQFGSLAVLLERDAAAVVRAEGEQPNLVEAPRETARHRPLDGTPS